MIRSFMRKNYKHFNAAVCVDAAEGWVNHLENKGKMLITIAGAMSTAELGISLAEMIREDKVHAISCTGANLEEDLFNLVAHTKYERIPHYRYMSLDDDQVLYEKHMNRVTDTCIPEEEAMRKIERHILKHWQDADRSQQRFFPHEFILAVLASGELKEEYEIDPKNSWLLAALEKKIPIFVPGWEDSTLGNFYVGHTLNGNITNVNTVKGGIEYMRELVRWYLEASVESSIGFFQIGGGIAGDFPICVVPLIHQDLQRKCPLWGYFCQVSDSTTSFGSYSGATPNEKITWGKLSKETPKFMIESDATIVAPLIFQYVLDTPAKN